MYVFKAFIQKGYVLYPLMFHLPKQVMWPSCYQWGREVCSSHSMQRGENGYL